MKKTYIIPVILIMILLAIGFYLGFLDNGPR